MVAHYGTDDHTALWKTKIHLLGGRGYVAHDRDAYSSHYNLQRRRGGEGGGWCRNIRDKMTVEKQECWGGGALSVCIICM